MFSTLVQKMIFVPHCIIHVYLNMWDWVSLFKKIAMTFNTHFCISTKATTLKQPDLLKISQIILSYPLADYFEFRACLADRCLCSQNINKYSNKHANECIQKNDSKSLRQSGYFRCQTCPVLQSNVFAKVMSTCFEHKVIKCANVENNLHIYFTQIKQGGFTFKLITSVVLDLGNLVGSAQYLVW